MRIEYYFFIDGKYELKNGLYNIEGDVILNESVEKLPFKFGKVTGDFFCNNNKLTTLEGSPNWVGGSFCCFRNRLISLEGCPTIVRGNFSCEVNKLKSLKGCPTRIGGNFYCDENLRNAKEYRQNLIMRKLRG